MKSRGGKSQRREEQRERVRRKKIQVREKVGKSRNNVFFQWFVAPEGRKVGSLKRRVRSQLARWEMKNCTPLWREAHFQVKMYKAHQVRTTFGSWDVEKAHVVVARRTFRSQSVKNWRVQSTFGSWDVEKVHAVVARSTFRSQKYKKLTGSEHFWKLRCRKSARCCGAKLCEAYFQVKMLKTQHFRTTFGRSDVVSRGRRTGLCTVSKVSKTWRSCSISKNVGRRGTFEEDLQRCIFRGRRSTRDMFIRAVWRWGRWFPERGCILEHQIFSSGKMILRERCSISYDLASLFRGRRSPLDRWSGRIAKRIGTRHKAVSSALNFPFWRKSRKIVSFLMSSSSKIEEVSQNSFVFKLADR